MRVSTQELDDVLAAHGVCHGSNCGWRPVHCEAHAEEVIPWPCLDYRLARDLKAALKVVKWARSVIEGCGHSGMCLFATRDRVLLKQAISGYDTEETQ